MGFVEVFGEKEYDEIPHIWYEFWNAKIRDNEDIKTVASRKIEDGMRFLVPKHVGLLSVRGNKVEDYCVGPGGFVYDSRFEPGIYTSYNKKYWNQIYSSNYDKLMDYDDARNYHNFTSSDNTRIIAVRIGQTVESDIEFNDIPFMDMEDMTEHQLSGKLHFGYVIADPMIFFTKNGSDVVKILKDGGLNPYESMLPVLKDELLNAFVSAIREMDVASIGVDKFIENNSYIWAKISKILEPIWVMKRGIGLWCFNIMEINEN